MAALACLVLLRLCMYLYLLWTVSLVRLVMRNCLDASFHFFFLSLSYRIIILACFFSPSPPPSELQSTLTLDDSQLRYLRLSFSSLLLSSLHPLCQGDPPPGKCSVAGTPSPSPGQHLMTNLSTFVVPAGGVIAAVPWYLYHCR